VQNLDDKTAKNEDSDLHQLKSSNSKDAKETKKSPGKALKSADPVQSTAVEVKSSTATNLRSQETKLTANLTIKIFIESIRMYLFDENCESLVRLIIDMIINL
jgi:hypothetical protein